MIAPLFPSLREALGLEPSDLSLLTGGYSGVYTIATLFAFSFFSHLSPIRLLRWGLIGLGLCNLSIIGCEDREVFIALRLITAFPHAFLLPAILTRMGQSGITKRTFRRGGWVLGGHGAAYLLGVPVLLLLVGIPLDPSLAFSLPGGFLLLLGLILLRSPDHCIAPSEKRPEFLKGWRELWHLQSPRFILLGAFCITASLSAFVYVFPTLHAEAKGVDASALAAWIFAAGVVQVGSTYLGGLWAAEKGIRLVVLTAVGLGLLSVVVIIYGSHFDGATTLYGCAYLGCVAASSLRQVPLSLGLLQHMPKDLRFGSSTALSAFHQAGRGTAGLLALLLLAGHSILGLTLGMGLLLFAAGSLIAAIQVPSSRNNSEDPGAIIETMTK